MLWRIKLKTLLLLRHATVNHFDENIEDHEKELNKDGEKESSQLANWLEKSDVKIDKIFSSSAKRALSTAKILFQNQKNFFEDNLLYLCDCLVILNLIKKQSKDVNNLAIIGHEPSLSETLKILVGNARPDLHYYRDMVFPTAGLAIINFNVLAWDKIDERSGTLDAFITTEYLLEQNAKD